MMIYRDTLRVQAAEAAGARILTELIYARLVGRTLRVRPAFRKNYIFCERENSNMRNNYLQL